VRALPPPRAAVSEDARRALDLLVTHWHEFTDLRTLADISVSRGSERQRLSGVLLARGPASLRFEALSPLGQPLLLATIADGQLTTYNPVRNEALVGPANADTAARLLSLALEPDDLVAILAGRAAPPIDVRVAELLSPDEHGPSLELTGRDHRERVWMNMTTGLVRRLEITGGRIEVRVEFVRTAEGVLGGFDFTTQPAYVAGSVRYQHPEFGVGIDPERFRLAIPPGAKVEALK
jgi:outer membrane lipoprotein-sorting protein